MFCSIFSFRNSGFFLIHSEYQKAILWCVLSLVLLLTLNADKIEAFKLWGLEAKLRQKIEQADNTIEQLKDIAGTIAQATLAEVIPGGFQSGMSLRERLEQHDRIVESLKRIGFTKEEIYEIKKDWRTGIERRYRGKIYSSVIRIAKENGKNISSFRGDWESFWNLETTTKISDKIKAYLKQQDIPVNAETNSLIEEYQNFLNTGDIRNREIFLKEYR